MRDEFTRVDYLGFIPGARLQTETDLTTEKIQSKAPSDAFVQVQLRKGSNKEFRCTIRVQSIKARFVVEKPATAPLKCLKRAEREMISEIEKWKSQRLFTPARGPELDKAV